MRHFSDEKTVEIVSLQLSNVTVFVHFICLFSQQVHHHRMRLVKLIKINGENHYRFQFQIEVLFWVLIAYMSLKRAWFNSVFIYLNETIII